MRKVTVNLPNRKNLNPKDIKDAKISILILIPNLKQNVTIKKYHRNLSKRTQMVLDKKFSKFMENMRQKKKYMKVKLLRAKRMQKEIVSKLKN